MRPQPTRLERRAGQALLDALSSANYIDNPMFGDRPDLVVQVNGCATGIEIVSLLPAKIHEAAKLHFATLFKKGVNWSKLVVPIEPDEWIKAAIENKWQIVQAYLKRHHPLRMNLLVHRPALLIDLEFADLGFINALSYGSARSKHGFDDVFYWSGTSIHRLAPPQQKVPPRIVDLSKGYPAWIFYSYTSEQSKTRSMLEGAAIPLAVPREHTKLITPMTPEFKGLKPLEPEGDVRIFFGFDEENQ